MRTYTESEKEAFWIFFDRYPVDDRELYEFFRAVRHVLFRDYGITTA
jgi:hypothetical protein